MPSREPAHDRAPLVPPSLARGLRGAVASPHHLASAAGIATLRAGGSAVDAAIATNAALSVVTSYMCGLGGDAFWLIWDGSRLDGLNGSGRSGRAASIEAAAAAGLTSMPFHGPWTVTVPGAIRSWADAHARHGRLRWPDLLRPAIELAEGFPASTAWSASVERAARAYGAESDWARVFRPHGRPWLVGERVSLPALGSTLERLAGDGPDAAYTGTLAARAAEYLGSRGSPLTREDFADHRSDWTEPIETVYRGVTATSHRPNSSGAIALELLNVLATLDPPPRDRFGEHGVEDARWIHLALETARLCLADRDAYLTDPDGMVPDALERLLSERHARALASRLDDRHVLAPRAHAGDRSGDTVYLATADRWGAAVSLIESNYSGFGSGLVDPATGVAYQNRGAFFSLDPGHANALAPRKRTMHTLTPGMLFRDGRPWIVHGSMGGEIQPQVFAQFVSAVVDGGLDIATALALPRWAADVAEHYGAPVVTRLERRIPEAIAADLAARGHRVEWGAAFDSGFGHAHAVEVRALDAGGAAGRADETVSLAAATDPRSEGLPAAW